LFGKKDLGQVLRGFSTRVSRFNSSFVKKIPIFLDRSDLSSLLLSKLLQSL
jgi:hypothetical protein